MRFNPNRLCSYGTIEISRVQESNQLVIGEMPVKNTKKLNKIRG